MPIAKNSVLSQILSRIFHIALFIVLLLESVAAHAQSYSLTQIGSFDGNPSHTYAAAINNSGQVTGYSDTTGHQDQAFLFSGGVMQDLGTLGGDFSEGIAINASGQVTGESYTPGNAALHVFETFNNVMQDVTIPNVSGRPNAINDAGQVTGDITGNIGPAGTTTSHAFIVSGGIMQDIGNASPNSHGTAINSSGQVTGLASSNSDGAVHAFIASDNSGMTLLPNLPGTSSVGAAINASGQIAGYTDNSNTAPLHAFVTMNGVIKDLGTLGGSTSNAVAINNSGEVAGYAMTASGNTHAFLAVNGLMSDLGTLGGTFSQATSLDSSGQIVGASTTSSGAAHAFLYQNGTMIDLNSLIDTHSSLRLYVTLTDALAITDTGYVLALGTDSRTMTNSYFVLDLKPVPLPAAVWLMLSGLIGLGGLTAPNMVGKGTLTIRPRAPSLRRWSNSISEWVRRRTTIRAPAD